MEKFSPWIEHIQHPLVLAGFALMAFAGLAKLIDISKLSGKDSGRLYGKIINGAFVLALLIVLLGLGQSLIPKPAEQANRNTDGTAINAQGDVRLGGSNAANKATATPPKPVNQTNEGTQGTAINSGGDVQLNPPPQPKPEPKRHAR